MRDHFMPIRMAIIKKKKKNTQKLTNVVRMWGIWNPCALLVRISNRAATVENSIIVSQKIKQSILI